MRSSRCKADICSDGLPGLLRLVALLQVRGQRSRAWKMTSGFFPCLDTSKLPAPLLGHSGNALAAP
ncbi:MAG: hypothetical protein U0235_21040 [Polyangiaceae bacterium]